MTELVLYCVHLPDAPIAQLDDMDRSAGAAWQRYLGKTLGAAVQPRDLKRSAEKAASMDGVQCWCYRLVRSGAMPYLGLY